MRKPAPKHLQATTKKWWLSVVNEWALDEHHLRLLTLCGEAWDRCEQAREILARDGLTYTDRFGQPCARPEIAVERDSRVAFARLLRELDLDAEGSTASRPPALKSNRGSLAIVRGTGNAA